MTNEEMNLITMVRFGVLDGSLFKDLVLDNGDILRYEIRGGKIVLYTQSLSLNVHVIKEWKSDEEILSFLYRYGWLMNDIDVRRYSARGIIGV